MTLTIYDAMVHLKKLETENIKTDKKWEFFKTLITIPLGEINSDFKNYSNIGIKTCRLNTTQEYCLFELLHRPLKHQYLFYVSKKNNNIVPLGFKKEGMSLRLYTLSSSAINLAKLKYVGKHN